MQFSFITKWSMLYFKCRYIQWVLKSLVQCTSITEPVERDIWIKPLTPEKGLNIHPKWRCMEERDGKQMLWNFISCCLWNNLILKEVRLILLFICQAVDITCSCMHEHDRAWYAGGDRGKSLTMSHTKSAIIGWQKRKLRNAEVGWLKCT